jgi:hypothetical protein
MRSQHSKFVLSLAACISASVAQSADYVDELKACTKVTDRDARFACYENLGKRALEDESVTEKSSAEMKVQSEAAVLVATGTASKAAALPDDLGIENTSQYRGLITSCKKNADEQWYFYFDNGQVWKQVDGRRRHYRKCNFYVTITNDGLGYKMQIDGDKNKVRISRRR